METSKHFLRILVLVFTFFSCDDTPQKNDIKLCNECVIVDNSLYSEINTSNYTISNVIVANDLLTIKISSSGCDGASWEASLVDAGEIAESFPIQRRVKIAIQNNETCLAVFEKEFTFDIKQLKENYDTIILNLEGWSSQIKI